MTEPKQTFDPRRHSSVVLRYNEKLPGVSMLTKSMELPLRSMAVGPHVQPGQATHAYRSSSRPSTAPGTRHADPMAPAWMDASGRWVAGELPYKPMNTPAQPLDATQRMGTMGTMGSVGTVKIANTMMPKKQGLVRPVSAVHSYNDISPVITEEFVRDADRMARTSTAKGHSRGYGSSPAAHSSPSGAPSHEAPMWSPHASPRSSSAAVSPGNAYSGHTHHLRAPTPTRRSSTPTRQASSESPYQAGYTREPLSGYSNNPYNATAPGGPYQAPYQAPAPNGPFQGARPGSPYGSARPGGPNQTGSANHTVRQSVTYQPARSGTPNRAAVPGPRKTHKAVVPYQAGYSNNPYQATAPRNPYQDDYPYQQFSEPGDPHQAVTLAHPYQDDQTYQAAAPGNPYQDPTAGNPYQAAPVGNPYIAAGYLNDPSPGNLVYQEAASNSPYQQAGHSNGPYQAAPVNQYKAVVPVNQYKTAKAVPGGARPGSSRASPVRRPATGQPTSTRQFITTAPAGAWAAHGELPRGMMTTTLSPYQQTLPSGRTRAVSASRAPHSTIPQNTGPWTSLAPQKDTILRTGQLGMPLPHPIAGTWHGRPGETADKYLEEQYSSMTRGQYIGADQNSPRATQYNSLPRKQYFGSEQNSPTATQQFETARGGTIGPAQGAQVHESVYTTNGVPNNANANGPYSASATNAYWPVQGTTSLGAGDLTRALELGQHVVPGTANTKLIGGRWKYVPRPAEGDVVYTDFYGPCGKEHANYYGRTYHVNTNEFAQHKLVDDSAYQKVRASMMGIQMLRDRPGLSLETAIVHGPTDVLADKLDDVTLTHGLSNLHRLTEYHNLEPAGMVA
mmetsp:Transcript_21656/g.36885  ORF Transcript_21656/g.36885 Transcript_21656/m.36885 type:complete len:844 (+) Transcript_21656:21-2552(+)